MHEGVVQRPGRQGCIAQDPVAVLHNPGCQLIPEQVGLGVDAKTEDVRKDGDHLLGAVDGVTIDPEQDHLCCAVSTVESSAVGFSGHGVQHIHRLHLPSVGDDMAVSEMDGPQVNCIWAEATVLAIDPTAGVADVDIIDEEGCGTEESASELLQSA
jgi:hypothetical protein